MLFDPGSTIDSVRANLNFLRTILADGCAAAVFCRMLPYDGTPIKDELERTGRLKGDIVKPDYDFLDPRTNALYQSLSGIVDVWGWIHGYRALSPQLNWVSNEIAIMERLCPLPDLPDLKQTVRRITRASNEILFEVVEDLLNIAVHGGTTTWTNERLDLYRRQFLDELIDSRNAFVSRHQNALLDSLQIESLQIDAPVPILAEAAIA
jgi:hypothetical protein